VALTFPCPFTPSSPRPGKEGRGIEAEPDLHHHPLIHGTVCLFVLTGIFDATGPQIVLRRGRCRWRPALIPAHGRSSNR